MRFSEDPVPWAVVDYSKIISHEKVRYSLLISQVRYYRLPPWLKYECFREFCNFPTVFDHLAENRLDLFIAAFRGEIHVTKLLTLETSFGFLSSKSIVRLTRVFVALSSCRKALILYYEGVRERKPPKFSCLIPKPIPVDPSYALPDLTDKRFLSKMANALVDLGDATTTMGQIPRILLADVREAIQPLHEKNVVFGDLRDEVLVDFDWPVVDGEGIYPAMFNLSSRFSGEVSPYGVMHKGHDLGQLKQLEKLLWR
ncbi:hypothetical protein M413DRAFT_26147 [Hebeloma cylindrosporum]|uniref:Uncharacterized protein n=1 Tax=Hebeloma cylindrosporum TaxID=76867 RepID=A0A0C2YS47_HEBCY|nr:hypothetical protein M413DRAFT_26147 [Hebeloma cylindrosporum h7]